MSLKSVRAVLVLATAAALMAGCASSQIKARREQREKVSQSSKLYCDFVNGELFPDVDVQLNLEMAKRCDSEKSFSVTNYKTSNENMGVIYCCALHDDMKSEMKAPMKAPEKAADKAAEAKKPEAKADAKKSGGIDELGD